MDVETMKTLFTYMDGLNSNLQRIAIALEKQSEQFDQFGHEFGRQHTTFKTIDANIVDIKKVLDDALTGGLITHNNT